MAENNELTLDEMLKAIPKLSDPDLKKLYTAIMNEARKKKILLGDRFGIPAGSRGRRG
jgi:hypothetical protein